MALAVSRWVWGTKDRDSGGVGCSGLKWPEKTVLKKREERVNGYGFQQLWRSVSC